MDWALLAQKILISVYTFALVVVCIYGFHRYVLVYLYYRHRRKTPGTGGGFSEADLPFVTVQLPMYNERYVARRVIEQTLRLDYPRAKLQIQVLDDSTDETVGIASATVERARAAGFDIEYIHRHDRTGFKAGALAGGLASAKGEFIAIFDADFMPGPEIIRDSIHYFTDPKVCAVQARWEHINRSDSLLTQSQAIFLDGHFAIEHVARNRSGRFMQFNGTAGTWRRSAIDDAGGWQHDTLTEDMDLSYRAQMRGWKFVFLPDLTAAAELPPDIDAFKAQQFRWTKGGAQTAIKMLPRLMLARNLSWKIKIEALFHLTCFSVHGFVVVLMTLLMPVMLIRMNEIGDTSALRAVIDWAVFALATLSASVFYVAGQFELFRNWRTVLKYLPFLMALGVGVCLSNTKALLEAVFGYTSDFVRTPKYGAGTAEYVARRRGGDTGAKSKRSLLPYLELTYGVYMFGCTVYCFINPKFLMAGPFFAIFTVGFSYVGILGLMGQRARAAAAAENAKLAPAEADDPSEP